MRVKVRLKHHNNAYYRLRTDDPAIRAFIDAEGDRVADAANAAMGEGPGHFIADSRRGRRRPYGRWRAGVVTATWKAQYYNAKTNILLRVLR